MWCGLCSHVWNMIWWRMSFGGARFLQLWQPPSTRHSPYTSFESLYLAVLSIHLAILHTFPHTFPPSSPRGSFYWAALKPDVPWTGRGSQMTCSLGVAHSPHNRLTPLQKPVLFFSSFFISVSFYFPILCSKQTFLPSSSSPPCSSCHIKPAT